MPAPKRPTRARNPYLNRVMIREVSDFYGRRREVAKIFARIGAPRPQSVAIVGERRIGKSSLLNYLCHSEIRRHHLENPEAYTFVLIDLQEQREIGIPAFFENLFQGIEQALGRTRPPDLPADYEGARRALLRLQEEGRKIILLFDEFDAITRNPNFPEEFFAFLRAIANKYDVAYVTTSGRDLQQLCHAERIADSPFFNIFSNLFLTRFEPEEALALIREPSEAAGIPLAPHAAGIIDLGGLFPFFLQMACAAYFEHLAEGIELDLTRVRASFLEEAEPHFKYISEHLDEDQRGVLRDLVEGRSVPPSRSYLLTRLKRDGYLLEENGRERLFSSAFAAWLQEERSSIEAPAVGRGAGVLAGSRDVSPIGRQIGPYQILSRLGAGGMGEVYRARDTKLGREVAIKVLPTAFVHDPDRLARFQREARLLAALNHPHIAAIYGLEEAGPSTLRPFDPSTSSGSSRAQSRDDEVRVGPSPAEGRQAQGRSEPGRGTTGSGQASVRALVMELVEGPTLGDRVARGPLPVGEALSLARQIADALEAAHQKGIIHRDLKPANIKVTPEGVVKVLDFGLAKALVGEESGPDLSRFPTVTTAVTQEGLVLGTPAYMSPEQSRGQAVDKRTDIWAFGCVLYELLTGRAPFPGETLSDTIARVLEREPQWKLLPAGTPPGIQRLLQRCLQKDPKQRLHDIADARIELDEALTPRQPGGSIVSWIQRAFHRGVRL